MKLKRGYGILKRFKRGHRILISLTFRCTLDCDYCTLKMYDGKMPVCKEKGFEFWKRRINQFPLKVREVVISGGEPMMHPIFESLVNYLLDNGLFVTVFTNLTIRKEVRKTTYRLRLSSTFHGRSMNLQQRAIWIRNYKYYKKYYRVDVDEIESKEIKGSRWKPFCIKEEAYDESGFFFRPDGSLAIDFMEMVAGHPVVRDKRKEEL